MIPVTTLTLNPCIDRTVVISSLIRGRLNQVVFTREDIGGKGFNVSSALTNLEVGTFALGLDFHTKELAVHTALEDRGIPHELIDVSGYLRTNIKLFEQESSVMTEFNEKGSEVDGDAIEKIKVLVADYAVKSNILALCGSVSPGMPDDIYMDLITICKKANPNVRIVLDTQGRRLTEAVKAKPYIIKPNLFELADAYGTTPHTIKDVVKLSHEIIKAGVSIVCTSLGADGAVLVCKSGSYHASSPSIGIESAQGAGDAMVAGMCTAVLANEKPDEILRYGVAAASATIIRRGTQMCLKEDFLKMLSRVTVRKI